MNKAPAFQFYPKDWLDFRVQRMSLGAQGAYMKILCFMWADSKDQCSILDDNTLLARALGTTVEQWLEFRGEILRDGDPIFEAKDGKLYSARLAHEASGQRKYRKLQSEKGKKSVEQRLNRGSTAVQPEYQPEGNSSSSSSSSSSLSLHPKKDSEKEETTLSRSSRDFMQEAREVLQFLNLKSGRQFREVDSNLRLIAARLKGSSKATEVDIQTCKSIIAKKTRAWALDPNMADYLRPETLFGAKKFESYLGEVSICTAQTVTVSSGENLRPACVDGEPKPCSPSQPIGSFSNVRSLVARS